MRREFRKRLVEFGSRSRIFKIVFLVSQRSATAQLPKDAKKLMDYLVIRSQALLGSTPASPTTPSSAGADEGAASRQIHARARRRRVEVVIRRPEAGGVFVFEGWFP